MYDVSLFFINHININISRKINYEFYNKNILKVVMNYIIRIISYFSEKKIISYIKISFYKINRNYIPITEPTYISFRISKV